MAVARGLGILPDVSIQAAQKLLFELRAVLDRIGENDITFEESIMHDVDRAKSLTDDCISLLDEDRDIADEGLTDAQAAGDEDTVA